MRVRIVVAVIGHMLRFFSLAFAAPLALAVWERAWTSAAHFALSGVAAAGVGTIAGWRYRQPAIFHRAEAMAVVAGTWVVVAIFAGLPYVMVGLSLDDALFESMSGLTTTGATILTDFSAYDRSFYFWRAMTQWFGGLGVIALGVVVLPRLGIAGRQLFFAEASTAPGEAVSPQVRQSASRLWILYCALTAACALLLTLSGMTFYEGVVHSFTTMAAGGFSPHSLSVGGYQNPAAEWILVVFMILAGASYPLQLKVFTGQDWLGFFRDSEFIFYVGVAGGGALIVAAILAGGLPGEEDLRAGSFQSASLISSTGYASTDYNLWSWPAKAILLIVMIVGGCAGSAAGGPKSIRLLLFLRHIRREITQVLHPRAVLPLRYKGQGIPDQVMRAVVTLVALYLSGYFLCGIAMVLFGNDPVTGFTASLACMGNIGPGFATVGPMGNFAAFSTAEKLLLTAAMWVGRLEILTVLALLHPHVWRALRWSEPESHGPSARA